MRTQILAEKTKKEPIFVPTGVGFSAGYQRENASEIAPPQTTQQLILVSNAQLVSSNG